jgi:hypothetical protein
MMWVFWLVAVPLAAGTVFTIGYHVGLKRASEAIWEACVDTANNVTPPLRQAIIDECIEAVVAIRPVMGQSGSLPPDEFNRIQWVLCGVDDAIDALRRMDKRGAGHYGVPRDIVELRSRLALAKAADED